MMAEGRATVDHTTIMRWIHQYSNSTPNEPDITYNTNPVPLTCTPIDIPEYVNWNFTFIKEGAVDITSLFEIMRTKSL